MITPDPQGWTVAVTHPDTARVKTPDVLDLQDAPALNPGPNAQPRLRLPVTKDDVWLSEGYDDDPEMRVWKDGRRLPIEVLRDVEQREDATVLVGVGGVELETRVSEEFNDDRRHEVAGDLVESETGYAVDAPEPDTASLENTIQQDADTEASFESASSFDSDDPILIDGDAVQTAQVCDNQNGRVDRVDSDGVAFPTDDEYVGGQSLSLPQNSDVFAEWEIQAWPYDIPPERVGLRVRDELAEGSSIDISWTINGETTPAFTPLGSLNLRWRDFRDEFASWEPSLNTESTNTLRVEVNSANDGEDYIVDQVAVYDRAYEDVLDFDNEVHEPGGELDGPGFHAPVDVAFDNAASAFNVVAGSADITMNDTSGAQRLQISNDNGSTWLPDDGSEENTTSVDVDYPAPGSGSRLRVTLDAYEPEGPRDETPRLNYASQELDAYTLRADIAQELLLIDEVFDNDLASVLTDIAEPAERSWRFAFDGETPTVRFVQDGQFTADFTPEFEARTREKLGRTYDSVTIKGSNEPVSNEPYTADTTFTALVQSNILPGSETVYDDAENYERGDDYEIRYRDGEIRATSGGDLTEGDGYRIDYRYQAQGTFENPDAPDDPEELVETVPGVTSTRLAEQVAFVIASDVATPRYAAEVTIPDPDPRFDPVDSLPPDALGIPTGVSPLEVRGDPELTERGLRVRFGTRPALESSLQRLSRQVSRVTDRS